MVLTAFLLVTLGAADQSGWHNYMPQGSGVHFSMPGTVHMDTAPDPTGGAKMLNRYRSEFKGNVYTILIGDVSSEFQPVVSQLWEQDRKGPKVKKILDNALKAQAAASGAKVRFNKFGDLKGFPILAQMQDNPDNSGTNTFAAFTKRGVVIASAVTPKTEDDVKEGMKFIGSVNLSDRS